MLWLLFLDFGTFYFYILHVYAYIRCSIQITCILSTDTLILTKNLCHHQVHTFLMFTNVLDNDRVYLNCKIQESMHLGMENIATFLNWIVHV